ncbi:quinone-dependent dihydroorotate dehydrogenase [Shimazuella sp. AN120528]|uniref:quinone-dependent dihydroorotate dehydrogenase n=1 Tax=Shimazuella soli TaxID=1892854 RepID=UPI001F1061D6|nr:quinone-dependent dihydroorotate dehydrogenase [Shimazuella soli]MCH5585327.1 quinone-dependent dihydroorotate dehydrogenase [Shimazuella soli]
MVYKSLRKLLFRMNAEQAHTMTIRGLQVMQSTPKISKFIQKRFTIIDKRLESTVCGLSFPNPVGLAAGFDKHANVYHGLSAFGFGFVEVGTLTPRPQVGNPKPRLFRLIEDEAIINRMGFNNHGIEDAKNTFQALSKPNIPIGINLGKNKDTPNEQASSDYRSGLMSLYDYADYFVLNVSSPNTEGLRDLQHVDALQKLLTSVLSTRDELLKETSSYRPVFLKIAPDLSLEQMKDIIQTAIKSGIDGIIATNTTISRENLHPSPYTKESGGLSGRPLTQKSTEFVRHIYHITEGKTPIIGVGGIFSGADAYEKICAGANLIQVYTGMIYEGPGIARKINTELLAILEEKGVHSLNEIVGSKTS